MTRSLLISDASSYKAIVVAAFLRRCYPDLRLITCDHRPLTRLFHTRHAHHHHVLSATPHDGDSYVKAVAALCQETTVDYFLPINSHEMDLVLEQRSLFANCLDYWGPLDAYRTLHLKNRLHETATGMGIRTPKQFDTAEESTFPAVVKPLDSSSSRGVRYVQSRDQLTTAIEKAKTPVVIQEFIQGDGAGYSVFAQNGAVKVGFGHRRLAQYPVAGGSSVWRETFQHESMARVAEQLDAETRWSGFAMFEFKMTPDNEAVLIEANPRIWGSIHQGLAAGINYFEALLGPPQKPLRRSTATTHLSPLIYSSLLGYALRGNFGLCARFMSRWPRSRADVCCFRDPLGYLSMTIGRLT